MGINIYDSSKFSWVTGIPGSRFNGTPSFNALGLMRSGVASKPNLLLVAALHALLRDKPSEQKDDLITALRNHGEDVERVANEVIQHWVSTAPQDSKFGEFIKQQTVAFNFRQFLKYMSLRSAAMLCIGDTYQIVHTILASVNAGQGWVGWMNEGGFEMEMVPIRSELERFLINDRGVDINATNAPTTHRTKQQGSKPMTNASANTAISISDSAKPMIDAVLKASGIQLGIDDLLSKVDQLNATAEELEITRKGAEEKVAELMAKLRQAQSAPTSLVVPAPANATRPAGKMEMKPIGQVFPQLAKYTFDVPVWTWDHQHPDVPVIDDNYIFRTSMLLKAVRAITRGDNIYLVGHTGCGKTTFIEQIAARLFWPVARVAMDSSIDRAELVGRMDLQADGKGGTTSKWLEGILELALPNGYILLTDEADAARPDALYALQEVFENRPKRLLEDGGRFIQYHPMTRIVATGNTAGNGDPSGLYPACRILSAATLDRFQTFIEVPYLTLEEEELLLERKTGLNKSMRTRLAKFAMEMREAFKRGEFPISYSPRRSVAFAKAVEDYLDLGKGAGIDFTKAASIAFSEKVHDPAPTEFRQRITEIAMAALGGVSSNVDL